MIVHSEKTSKIIMILLCFIGYMSQAQIHEKAKKEVIKDSVREVSVTELDEMPKFKDSPDFRDNREAAIYFRQRLTNFVAQNIDTELLSTLATEELTRISTRFRIDTEGNVKDIVADAANEGLENEAIRVLKKLPQFIPGREKGQPKDVSYVLPIVFNTISEKEIPEDENSK